MSVETLVIEGGELLSFSGAERWAESLKAVSITECATASEAFQQFKGWSTGDL